VLQFEAAITAVGETRDGNYFTVLDRSAFYPTSGGQAHDTGRLGDQDVIDVREQGEAVHHITAGRVGEVGDTVTGVVDAGRRWMHRQQHTAQHILSQAFMLVAEAPTVSVHLGEEYGAIEFDVPELTDDQVARAEIEANDAIFAAMPVEIRFVDSEDIAKLPLRRPPKRGGRLRLIKIGEYDWSACGGTHCRNTAQVGQIKIVGVDKLRGRPLVKFLAGAQARSDYDLRFAVTADVSQHLTCHVRDLPERVRQLTEDNRALKQEVASLQRQMLPIRAAGIADEVQTVAGHTYVAASVDDLDGGLLNRLAQDVAGRIDGIAVLFAEGRVVLAVPEGGRLHAGDIFKSVGRQIGLRGGGNQAVAQGGSGECTPEQFTEAVSGVLEHG
jgi:alanyl-tRNA synthetase